jgi:signal transduction histidine kinase
MPRHALQQTGLGIRMIKHRAELIGATLVFQEGETGGTKVICSVPLPEENAKVTHA